MSDKDWFESIPSPFDKPAATVHGTGSGEAHYYCVNQRCQFIAHVKPPERKCPLCGSQVWKEGSSVEEFKTKQRPRCFACEGPMPASPTVTLDRETWDIKLREIYESKDLLEVRRKVFAALALLRAAERQKRIRRLKSPAGPVQATDTNAAPVDQRRTE